MTDLLDLLPSERTLTDKTALEDYTDNCTGMKRLVRAVLFPESQDEVAAIVRMAARHNIPLYPVSTGKNWGYGSASPMVDGCVVVDLSRMSRILGFDEELGIVHVEPGVTQKILSEFLRERNLPYLVPTTGAGPHCSLLGNALERGFGVTPYTDHFSAVMDLEAVLPDGSIYRSVFSELGGHTISSAFKWKVGPYIDGLFSQGNFGIVTRMSLALAPRPEHVEGFYFSVRSDGDLEAVADTVRDLIQDLGGIIGGCNLLNDLRVLSMKTHCPAPQRERGASVALDAVRELAGRHQVFPWSGFGTLYGSPAMVAAARKEIRRRLRSRTAMLVFLSPRSVKWFTRLARWFPLPGKGQILENLRTVERSLEIAAGIPSTAALPLVDWRASSPSVSTDDIDPDQGDCGLLWYAPIVPFRARDIRAFTTMVNLVCRRHEIDPMITLTAFTNRCVDCTVPLLFNRSRPEEAERAHACYKELFDEGRKLGCIPYRTGIQGGRQLMSPESVFWKVQALLKKAIDPQGIIAPGRYSDEETPR